MNDFIFINPDIDQCTIVYAQESDINKNKKGNLISLLQELKNTSLITFVLSKYCAYKDTIDIPPKNKSIFLKNAENIIRQDLPDDNKKILIQPIEGNKLPFIVISNETAEILNNVRKQFKLEKNKVFVEKDLFQSSSKNWHININDRELMIHYNNRVLQSNVETFKEDIQIVLDREQNPDLIMWKYSFDKDQSISMIQNLQSIVKGLIKSDQKIEYLMNDSEHIKNSSDESILIKDMVNREKYYTSYLQNWKSINYLIISTLLLSALSIQYINTSRYASIIETRQTSMLNAIFVDMNSSNRALDLETVVSKISYSSNLPERNYIITLNQLGDMFNQPGLKLKKLEITESQDINIVFIADGEGVISQINKVLQESSTFKVNINSIQNDNQNKIIIDLSMKYKNE